MTVDIGNKCVHCKEDTSFGSGKFVNRYPVFGLDPDGTGTEYDGSSFELAGSDVTTGTLNVPDNGTITDINVTISGTTNELYYISFKLISPYGTTVDLVTSSDWSGNTFSSTTFDDEASIPIANGSVPYFGSFQPVGSLSDFDQEEMQGEWTLWAYNSNDFYTVLSAWSITVVTSPPLTDFTATPTSGQVPLTVQFTDQSIDIDGEVVVKKLGRMERSLLELAFDFPAAFGPVINIFLTESPPMLTLLAIGLSTIKL